MKRLSIVSIVLACVVIGAAYFFYSSKDFSGVSNTSSGEQGGQNDAKLRDVPKGFKEYRNLRFHFSLLYPEDFTVEEIREGLSASTITFEQETEGRGFQIFVLAYPQLTVTEERFAMDIPSGVRTNEEVVMVDGASGVAFYSNDLIYGDMREVWFINNGYLYEVTTIKPLEGELLEVLQTWLFL